MLEIVEVAQSNCHHFTELIFLLLSDLRVQKFLQLGGHERIDTFHDLDHRQLAESGAKFKSYSILKQKECKSDLVDAFGF